MYVDKENQKLLFSPFENLIRQHRLSAHSFFIHVQESLLLCFIVPKYTLNDKTFSIFSKWK